MAAAPLVLLVDDHQDTRELYASYFEACGFRVITAADAPAAHTLAAELSPDVIVTDLGLPGKDGIAFVRGLRSDSATADTPVLVVSGSDDGLRNDQLTTLGVKRVLLKPVLPDELCRQVETVLGLN